MLKKTVAALSVAAIAGVGALDMLPEAAAKSPGQYDGVQLAACNPCAAKNPCAARNPCNPCAAKKIPAANPCNPCAAKNPCNPCAAKNPCNPCAAKK